MANLSLQSIWTCDSGHIRVTPNGQPSVFDMIKTLGSQKNPHQVWERFSYTHPEVLTKCENFRFAMESNHYPPPLDKYLFSNLCCLSKFPA